MTKIYFNDKNCILNGMYSMYMSIYATPLNYTIASLVIHNSNT